MYELFRGDEEDSFVMLEWWADAAAIDAHMKTPHIQTGRRRTITTKSRAQFTHLVTRSFYSG